MLHCCQGAVVEKHFGASSLMLTIQVRPSRRPGRYSLRVRGSCDVPPLSRAFSHYTWTVHTRCRLEQGQHEQQRESSLKYMTRSIAAGPDGQG
jgi:hypothetical protein